MNHSEYKFIDIHYHANPDLYDRRWHALEAGKIYQSLHGAVYLTSHLGATSIQATLAQQSGLPIFPSVVLNHIAGGVNYRTVVQALTEYQPLMAARMIVHFPTCTGRNYCSRLTREFSHSEFTGYSQKGETVFNAQGKLRANALDILKMARDYPIVLSTGHAAKQEIYSMIDACIKYNVPALLLNQPAHPLVDLKSSTLKELAKNEFVWFEQTTLTYLLEYQDKKDLKSVLTTIPRVIYSSDLGQTNLMDVAQWLDFTTALFDEFQLSPQRRKELVLSNAAKLLSFDIDGSP